MNCNQKNAGEIFHSYNSILSNIFNETFPDVSRKSKPLDILKPYINAELRELIKEKHRIEQKIETSYHFRIRWLRQICVLKKIGKY